MENQRKYQFNWDNTVGADMKLARPSLGPSTRVEVYRLFQFTLRDILESFSGKNFNVREIDCWCTGARTCRFEAKMVS